MQQTKQLHGITYISLYKKYNKLYKWHWHCLSHYSDILSINGNVSLLYMYCQHNRRSF